MNMSYVTGTPFFPRKLLQTWRELLSQNIQVVCFWHAHGMNLPCVVPLQTPVTNLVGVSGNSGSGLLALMVANCWLLMYTWSIPPIRPGAAACARWTFRTFRMGPLPYASPSSSDCIILGGEMRLIPSEGYLKG